MNYKLEKDTSKQELANVLRSWAVNMRKMNGEEYKDYSVKTMWNTTAKMLQDKYYNEYNQTFNPFTDVEFQTARNAKNAKRKVLQIQPEKRKMSAPALNIEEFNKMIESWDEETPEGCS
jgi:hypothetical protein